MEEQKKIKEKKEAEKQKEAAASVAAKAVEGPKTVTKAKKKVEKVAREPSSSEDDSPEKPRRHKEGSRLGTNVDLVGYVTVK